MQSSVGCFGRMSTIESWSFYARNNFVVNVVSATLVVVAVQWLVRYIITITRLPPGPWGLPIVGYVPWMGKNAHETFAKLGKIYGGVFSINLGGETMVVLNDWPSIKATFVDQPKHFDGRPTNIFLLQMLTQRKDIGYNDGPIWVKQRQLVMKCLRSIGMGKKSMEGLLMNAAQEISTTLNEYDGNTIEMKSIFFKPILRLNWRLIASHYFEEQQLDDFERDIDVIFKVIRPDHPLFVLPWLRFFPPTCFGYKKLLKSYHNVRTHFKKLIAQHLANRDDSYSERDFVDHYLDAIKINNKEFTQSNPPYDVEHLKATMLDLFTAGVDTASTTCLWGFLYLATYPQVQRKVQMEMDSVVGRQRMPNIDDFPRLPYFVATVMEIHRLASVAPLAVPHRVTRTSNIYDYTIPKDTTCIQNIYAVHRDPQLWEEPDAFRPERFLDEHNNVTWPPYLMPFSIGPRVCIGQDLAEMVLRTFFSCLLHRFTFALPQHLPTPTFKPDVGLTLKPFPYQLQICTRND